MSASESPSKRLAVCDTVVVSYFLAVGHFELLASVLGGAVQVPRAVFDPEEPEDIADEAASELRRGLRLHRRRSADDAIGGEIRARSGRALPNFERLPDLAASGALAAVEMSANELAVYAQLRDRDFVRQFSRIAGLGRGEAAALAIASERGYDLVTDDTDAIEVAKTLPQQVATRRIRGLLVEAVDQGMIDKTEAQEIHAAMLEAGFWDTGRIEW